MASIEEGRETLVEGSAMMDITGSDIRTNECILVDEHMQGSG